MSMTTPPSNRTARHDARRSPWTSIAFMVESVLLLVFLAGSLAVLTQVFVTSLNHSVQSRTLDAATIAASSIAEHFASNPTDVQEQTQLGDLLVKCTVSDEKRAAGTMYRAHIDVYSTYSEDVSTPVYSIDTSSYQPEG